MNGNLIDGASSRLGCRDGNGEEMVKASGEVSLEAAERALPCLPFGSFAFEVGPGGRVVAGAGDRDDVQRVIELAVSAAVKPVLVALT